MTTKTNSEMLKSIKSYNKVVREGKAVKEGFANANDMISSLEGIIALGKGAENYISPASMKAKFDTPKKKSNQAKTKSSDSRVTIHVVDVLDASGSMSGQKYNAAVKGINIGIGNLIIDTANVDYTYTLCDFSNDIIFRHKLALLKEVRDFKGETRGATALYDAIGESIELIVKSFNLNDKVLVNIYTDGQENASRRFNANKIASLIEDLSKQGWTFTFIGTKEDVKYAQQHLKFDISNTLVHDNTGAGLEKAFTTNSASRYAYSQKVEAGEDVSKGFYKDIN